uniref:Uncharacterized protein n=1 Tax=Arundo donax TaxID=35708 RepID=A0A0A9A8X3_ARUDO
MAWHKEDHKEDLRDISNTNKVLCMTVVTTSY